MAAYGPIDYNPTEKCTAGERYEAMVPDTLDLAERMTLAVNALTNVWYPQGKWCICFGVSFAYRQPVRWLDRIVDSGCRRKFMEALVVCRLGCGSRQNQEIDRHVFNALIDSTGEDGLTYFPTDAMEGLPDYNVPTFTETYPEGRTLVALSMLCQVDDNPQWLAMGQKKTDRLLALTREKDGYRYFWKGRFRPNQEVPDDAPDPYDRTTPIPDRGFRDWNPEASMTYSIVAGYGAGVFYRATGYEPALELSRGLARWALTRLWNREDGWQTHWHFHHGLAALNSVCEYGVAANDREVLERVDACYRWSREMGDPLIGFYPEHMYGGPGVFAATKQGSSVEICEVADMLILALYLTRAGVADYWDDVDRWVRNIFTEGQMVSTDFLDKIPEKYFRTDTLSKPHMETEHVAEKSVGSFFGWIRANDGLYVQMETDGPYLIPTRLQDVSIMHCCTGNGARVLYFVWDSIVTKEADEVSVNLLLNRSSPWLDVDSYLPVDGKVVLHIKDAPKVSVRIPQWCDPAEVQVTVTGQPRKAIVQGRFVKIGWLRPADVVTLEFPVPQRVMARVIGELPYKLTLRGSNVVDIEPKGIGYPLYENQPTGKLVKKTRFVPSQRHVIW